MKFDVCGIPVDRCTTEAVVERALDHVAGGEGPLTILSCNVDMVVKAHRDPDFARVLGSGDVVTADGMPVVWLGRLLGADFPERVAGSDLVPRIAAACAARGHSVFLFGAAEGVAEAAAARLREAHPALRVAGVLSPPLGFERDPQALEAALAAVRAAAPDVLFVALSAPRQERFVQAHARALGAKVILGIGGSLDMLAGRVRRAPSLVQRTGTEWLWRLAQEPRRLARRYLVEDAAFARIAAAELWKRRGPGASAG
ncbi:WecB/TagA/CpsF family glycosyltransferase [Vulgatibacter sp.]|uniref:WecB/TagA/CpsF family glycosyltransferase n=1 Tax=Vulgatibacter sp. TaxID=1971226 RepID=UPI0035649B90